METRITIAAAKFVRQLKDNYAQYEAVADDKLLAMFIKKFPSYQATYAGSTPVSVSFAPPAEQPVPVAEVQQSGTSQHEPSISVQLPVRIWGMDIFGLPFSQSASTVSISPQGALLLGVKCMLATDDVLGLSRDNQKGRFRITWVGQFGTSQAGQISVRSLDLDRSLWGEEFTKRFTPKSDERRFSPRFLCPGSVAVWQKGTNYPIYSSTSDLSIGGCYVEMMTPLPVGTKVALLLNLSGVTIRMMATVRTSHPAVGMGLRFEEMTDADRQMLQETLAKMEKETHP